MMNTTYGIGFIVFCIFMVWIARPRNGKTVFFVRSWLIGQIYGMTALSSGTYGITLLFLAATR